MSTSALSDIAATIAPFLVDTDTAAIHEATAGEIGDITAKATPAVDDVALIEDAGDGEAKKSYTLGSLFKMLGWITGLTAKATPVAADILAVEDSADSLTPKRSTLLQLFGASGLVSGLTAKATPVAADILLVNDSASSNAAKRSTLQQLFAALGLIDGLTSKATPVAADTLAVNDSAAGGAAKKITIGSLPIAQAQVVGILLEPAADAAVELLGTTSAVVLTVTAAPTVVISNGAGLYAGQRIEFRAAAVSGGGKYTVAVQGGALTIDATDEEPVIKRNAANDAWVVVSKGGATIV
jgi:hypothetical protein